MQAVFLKRGNEYSYFAGDKPPSKGIWLHFGEMRQGEKVYEEITGVEMPSLKKEKDFHYGINPPYGEDLGHRKQSISMYGGSVGEYTFSPNSYPHAQKPNYALDQYQSSFNMNVDVKQGQYGKYMHEGINNNFNPNTGNISKQIEWEDDYDASSDIEDQFGEQMGTRFSKGTIAYTASIGGSIRFHLDGMGTKKELLQILNKTHPKYSYAVTSRELRFIHRYWDNPLPLPGNKSVKLQDVVVFYKNNRSVHPPWSGAYQD